MAMDVFCRTFKAAFPDLKRKILDAFNSQATKAGFRSVWEHFEDVINPVLIDFFTRPPLSVPRSDITVAKSKSVYPDLKIRYRGKNYSVDVKSGEDHINPWYDMGRLDTYEESRLQKYAEEYCITVRWRNRAAPEVIDVYIEPAYKSVGYRAESDGVLYRPYDGKLRPKPWLDFESGTSHWHDLEHFKRGLENSRDYRRRSFIVEWYKSMTQSQRHELKIDIAAIDSGKSVVLDRELPITESTDGA